MGIRTRRARNHSKTHAVGFGAAGVIGFIFLLIVSLVLSLGAIVSSWLEDLPDYESADAYLVAEPTTLYDADGNEIAKYYLQNRRSITMDQVPQWVIDGTIDVEDIRFYTHNGVDPQGIVRAVFAHLAGGSEGASTITQQLVRNTVLSDEQFEYSLSRKVREAYIAIQMEKMFSKDQILMMYLNTIYYGHGAYGIEAASITYFNKSASELTLAEAALLVGLPQSPSYLDPTQNPEAAVNRRNQVLDRMLFAGDITQEQFDEASSEELNLNLGEIVDAVGTYPYFTDYVRQLLLEDFSSDTILQGGLRVYTTITPSYQAEADRACSEYLASVDNERLDTALVCVENSTGYILAMVGGRDYEESQFNLATQARRQCGSSFKTYTLVAAIREGMNPNIMLDCSSPMQITPTWLVRNFGNHDYGDRTLASATAISSNTAYAQVAEAIGAEKIVETCHLMGIDVDLPSYLSITLGSAGVPPVQMAEGYSTLANGGIHRDTVAITRIEDRNGNVVYQHEDNPEQVLEAGVAQATTGVLRTVVSGGGTGYLIANRWAVNQPVAGKTGTSDDAEDLWFCGYTPQYTTVVWAGYPDARDTVYVNGYYGTTQNTVQIVWVDFMNAILAGVPRAEFPTEANATFKPNTYWKFVGTSAALNDPNAEKEKEEEEEDEEEKKKEEEEKKKQEEEQQGTTGGETGGGTTGGGTTGGETGGGTSGGGTGGSTGGETGGGGSTGGETGGGTGGGETGGGTGGETGGGETGGGGSTGGETGGGETGGGSTGGETGGGETGGGETGGGA